MVTVDGLFSRCVHAANIGNIGNKRANKTVRLISISSLLNNFALLYYPIKNRPSSSLASFRFLIKLFYFIPVKIIKKCFNIGLAIGAGVYEI